MPNFLRHTLILITLYFLLFLYLILNIVVTPLFLYVSWLTIIFILYVCIHYNMYIGPSLPSLSHSFHVNGLQTGQKWQDTLSVPHLYPNGVHIFIYPQFYIIKVPQCALR